MIFIRNRTFLFQHRITKKKSRAIKYAHQGFKNIEAASVSTCHDSEDNFTSKYKKVVRAGYILTMCNKQRQFMFANNIAHKTLFKQLGE